MVKGLLAETKVSKMDGTSALLTVNYYDKRGRLIQSIAQNHLEGTDRVTNTYSFPGELLTSTHEHIPKSDSTTTILTTNTYDHTGRLIETRKKVNKQTEVLQSKLSYNEIGQLKTKDLHWNPAAGKFLNTIAYKYNTRGWLKESRGENFIQVLRYDSLDAGYTKQYNGNISQQYWRYTPTESSRMTVYSYDKLNRLKLATSDGVALSEELTYDDMGNIRTLKRDVGTTTTYNYTNSNKSNRLLKLTGGISGDYTYDENGNAKTGRMGISFTYNHLNLPQSASRAASANVSAIAVNYLYDAMGSKLRKTATVSGTTTVRDYVAGIEYAKTGTGASTIERIATEEGYLQNNSGTYVHHYNLTDHLGNVRSVIRAEGSGVAVIQKQDYYAFGKTKSIVTGGINRYLYNGKEVQAEIGDQLDYGARFYDSEIGRWNVVDPLAEKGRRWSPYTFVFNNPMRFVDPDGMEGTDFVKRKDGSIYWDNKANDQASTKFGETYLGKTLKFEFNSYIDGASWDGPTMGGLIDPSGDKLTSTVTLNASENENGELTGLSASKSVKVGDTPFGEARSYYSGEGGSNNVLTKSTNAQGTNINFEQHGSVSKLEELSLNAIGYKIVDVAQKLNINYNNSNGNLSVTAFTNVFPSATLKVNVGTMMKYNQPSFIQTHAAPYRAVPYGGRAYDFSYYPTKFYKR